jgi:hypothetical protein
MHNSKGQTTLSMNRRRSPSNMVITSTGCMVGHAPGMVRNPSCPGLSIRELPSFEMSNSEKLFSPVPPSGLPALFGDLPPQFSVQCSLQPVVDRVSPYTDQD